MCGKIIAIACLGFAALSASAQGNSSIYTLYRNSLMDPAMRIHIATFDAGDGREYNAENCNLTADFFAKHAGVKTRYWCEPGRYRK